MDIHAGDSSEFSYAVVKEPIEGIYVTVSALDPLGMLNKLLLKKRLSSLVWFGLLIVRVGTFCGGMFRFSEY